MHSRTYPFDPDETACLAQGAWRELDRYKVVSLGDLTGDRLLEVNRRAHLITVQDGQPLGLFRHLVDLATRFVIGGVALAPEFHVQPRLSLVVAAPTTEPEACPACRRAV